MLRAAAQRSRGLRRARAAGPGSADQLPAGPKAADEPKQMGRNEQQQPQNKTKTKTNPLQTQKGMEVGCQLAQARCARKGYSGNPGRDVPLLPPAPLTEEKNKKKA